MAVLCISNVNGSGFLLPHSLCCRVVFILLALIPTDMTRHIDTKQIDQTHSRGRRKSCCIRFFPSSTSSSPSAFPPSLTRYRCQISVKHQRKPEENARGRTRSPRDFISKSVPPPPPPSSLLPVLSSLSQRCQQSAQYSVASV